jgi:hypothetical protein
MVDYLPLRSNNHRLPEPTPEEDQESLQPEVDVVWNVYSERGDAKSMAVKVSLRLPNASRYSHCEAVAQFTGYSRNHMKKEA